ncbi:hypothetical protein FRC09_004253 [Ceratobasidium sp. 395]|nr:hypothetical protein FRC09_004253 [Ceratobasidium sp. 395]
MIAFGWRQGTDKGHRGGTYARAEDGQKKLKGYQVAHSRIATYFGRKFQMQAPALHGFNNDFIRKHRLPRIDDKELGLKDGTSAPASNLTVTTLDFRNGIHKDEDATTYTFGQWFPTYDDGRLVENPEEARAMTSGGYFVLPDYGIAIDFGSCAGVVSLTWRGPLDYHGTTTSVTKPGYYRWGTSIQCAKRLQNAVSLQRRVLSGEQIKMRGKSEQGKPRFVQVLKIKDFYARSGLPRPEHPNPRWYEEIWEGDDEYVEQEVSAVDVEDEEVGDEGEEVGDEGEEVGDEGEEVGGGDDENEDSDEYQYESDEVGESDED